MTSRLVTATAALLMTVALAACTGGTSDPDPVAAPGDPTLPGDAAAADSGSEASPSPSPSDDGPRPMEVGDCLNKIGVDEFGKPIPQYIPCEEPHMFEVTGLFTSTYAGEPFNFELFDDAIKATCRGAYESYTGRDTREVGNAFGWDQPAQAAWEAGDYTFPCYATAPAFGDLVGSLAR